MQFLSRILLGRGDSKLTTEQILFFLLILSAVIGPGISYGKLYFFHIVLAVKIVYLSLRSKKQFFSDISQLFSSKHWLNFFFIITILYFLIRIPFVPNHFYAIRHIVFITLGFSICLLIVRQTKSFKDFKFLFRSLAVAYCIDILVATLEALQVFRWPISKISSINHWFNRENLLNEMLESVTSETYVYSMPTSFHWNPNDFSAFAIMGLPFFFFHKKYWVSLIGMLTVISLIVAAGAKSSFIGVILIGILSLFFLKSKWRQTVSLLTTIIFFLTAGFGFSVFESSQKMEEIQSLVYKPQQKTSVTLEETLEETNQSSSEYRMNLIDRAILVFKNHPIWGVGGGNSQHYLEEAGGVGDYKITNIHNFWLELLVEGGLVFFALFVFWCLSLVIKLLKAIFELDSQSKWWYYVVSISLTLAGFLAAGIGPSSLLGFLPLYLLLGTIVALVLNLPQENSLEQLIKSKLKR